MKDQVTPQPELPPSPCREVEIPFIDGEFMTLRNCLAQIRLLELWLKEKRQTRRRVRKAERFWLMDQLESIRFRIPILERHREASPAREALAALEARFGSLLPAPGSVKRGLRLLCGPYPIEACLARIRALELWLEEKEKGGRPLLDEERDWVGGQFLKVEISIGFIHRYLQAPEATSALRSLEARFDALEACGDQPRLTCDSLKEKIDLEIREIRIKRMGQFGGPTPEARGVPVCLPGHTG